jgi:site-specific DNA-methyltransferase (adenine-specific)
MEATLDVWELPAESASRVGHPAPFPVALPERLIHLYTYVGDVVLDPFMGSGSTAVAAVRTGRHFVGYDTDPAYVAAATDRAMAERATTAPSVDPHAVALPPGTATGLDPLTAGAAARDLARTALVDAGFTDLVDDASVVPGVQPTFRATASDGTVWWFEVAGGRTGTRPGLQRVEVLWRAIAKGAVVAAHDPSQRYAVLHCGLPSGASGGRALTEVTGPGRPVAGLVDLLASDAAAQVRHLAAT